VVSFAALWRTKRTHNTRRDLRLRHLPIQSPWRQPPRQQQLAVLSMRLEKPYGAPGRARDEPGKIDRRSGQPVDLARILDRWFADSPLEEAGFELLVPRDLTKASRPPHFAFADCC
jgi:hypothetical protein